ncbi:poly(R)-hydroxyalkanoic acid synthase subunit PhaE [Gammaproteobacteria bacterium]|nr:poly(R)-hydroxyalkanoic acid synthase subunit PhaE [Gammaproteobacteria bacterium]
MSSNDSSAASGWNMSEHSALLNVGDGAFFPINRAALGYQAFLESMSEIVLRQGLEDDIGQSIIDFIDKLREQLPAGVKDCHPSNWYVNPIYPALLVLSESNLKELNDIQLATEAWVEKGSSIPVVGPQREWQTTFLSVQHDHIQCHKAIVVLCRHYYSATEEALRCFSLALAGMDDNRKINTLAQLYDFWIGIAEGVYNTTLMRDSFSRDFGDAVNALSKYKKSVTKISDMILGAMDLPDIKMIKNLLSKQGDLESQLRDLRLELTNLRDK